MPAVAPPIPRSALPTAVADEFERRRLALGVLGPALELVGPPVGPLPAVGAAPERRIVSVGWIAAHPAPEQAARLLAERLAPDGELHVVEPSISSGLRGRVQRAAAGVVARRTGWRIDADVPEALRRAGFLITELERFAMPRSHPLLVGGVAARAVLRTAP